MSGISRNSRYAYSTIVKEGEIYYIVGFDPITFRDYPDNIEHVWVQSDRLDLLAQKYYGDFRLWWIIAEFNDIIDFFQDIEVGTKLIIPSFSRVVTDIL
jgi:hypothetical protein